jgi:trans-aconitate 2-methyltransferase
MYERFADERSRPFVDLVAGCRPIPGGRAVDLGCGTGALTVTLPERLGVGEVLGIDSSPAMLDSARPRATDTVRFEEGDLGSFEQPDAWDLVIANASMQWVADHPGVLARWARSLRSGGQLAVQVPSNDDHPAARAIVQTALDWGLPAEVSNDPVALNVLTPERYATVLDDLGLTDIVVRLQVYGPRLDRSVDVVEWLQGTSLTRIRRALGDEQAYDRFVARLRQNIVEAIGDRTPYWFTFKRICCWATRP